MNTLQSIARSLLAAGYGEGNGKKNQYLLYVSNGIQAYLQCHQWSGDSMINQSLIVETVCPNSTAVYLITPTAKIVVGISPTFSLLAYIYDSEDREWVELDEWNEGSPVKPLPAHNLHREGRVAGAVDASGRINLIFQNEEGQLVVLLYMRNSWFATALSANPVMGSPLALTIIGDISYVFYVSAMDGCIHLVSGTNGKWNDRIVTKTEVEKGVKNFRLVIGYGSGDDKELYVLTKEERILKIAIDSGRITKLGIIKAGKFLSERSLDHCVVEAWNGTLTEENLSSYIQNDPACIDSSGSEHDVTPLAASVIHGHIHVVRLLIKYKANPNALSARKRTPLFYATSSTSISDSGDRLAIVQMLLEAGANVDECYAENGFNTPLMNSITLLGDQRIVNELLEHGASPTAKDVTGESAESLAKGTPMESVVAEKAEQAKTTPFEKQLIEFLVALIIFLVAFINNEKVKGIIEQIIVKLKENQEAETNPKFVLSSLGSLMRSDSLTRTSRTKALSDRPKHISAASTEMAVQ